MGHEESENHIVNKQLPEVKRADENTVLLMQFLSYEGKKPIESVAWSLKSTSARLNYKF